MIQATREIGPKIVIRTNVFVLALLAILLLTLANGFYNSLNVEYQEPYTNFLFLPEDRHADLIKAALSMPPFAPAFQPGRDDYFRDFYFHNPYHGLEGLDKGETTNLHQAPFMLLIFLLIKQAIVAMGAMNVVYLFYFISFLFLLLILLRFRLGFGRLILAFTVLALSYPFLYILSRGNIGALITSSALILFLHEVWMGRSAVLAAVCLALAINCRPNVVFMAPLLLVFIGNGFIRGLSTFLFVSTLLFASCYSLSIHLYPGYNMAVFEKALSGYYGTYVVNGGGEFTLYGTLQPWVVFLHLPQPAYLAVVKSLIIGATVCVGLAILVFSFFYLRRQIDVYEFTFAAGTLYIYGSTLISPYHIFFLSALILAANSSVFSAQKSTHYLILFTTIFLLVPKEYYFLWKTDLLQSAANSLVLIGTLLFILRKRIPIPAKISFMKAFRWNIPTGLSATPSTGSE